MRTRVGTHNDGALAEKGCQPVECESAGQHVTGNAALAGQGGQMMTANGRVTGTDVGQITVASQPHGDVVVMVDVNTIIRKQGDVIMLDGIHLDDEVNAMGTRIDDHTLQALQIEVRGVSGRH